MTSTSTPYRAERTLPGWLRFVAPVVVGVIILVLWTIYVATGAAPRMLPSPSQIGTEFVLRWDIIAQDMAITATNALVGLVVGATLALLLAQPAEASYMDGNSLHRFCGSSPVLVTSYLGGALDMSREPELVQCIPDNARIGQLRDVLCKWLEEHPELRHLDGDLVVIVALKQSFGCAAS